MLKKAAMNVLVKHLDGSQISDLKKEFQKLDTNKSGFLERSNLRTVLMNYRQDSLDSKTVTQLIEEVDFAGNNKINYSEFLAATIEANDVMTQERLQSIFNTFDVDRSGFITAQNIKDAFSKLGREISEKDIKKIFKEHDLDQDEFVSFEEFKNMMLK